MTYETYKFLLDPKNQLGDLKNKYWKAAVAWV